MRLTRARYDPAAHARPFRPMIALLCTAYLDRRSCCSDDLRCMRRAIRSSDQHFQEVLCSGQRLQLGLSTAALHDVSGRKDRDVLLRHANVSIVADARIDNREELIRRLPLRHRSKELSDTELIVLAYLEWGVSAPAHLLGDFAFILWDASAQRLLCARDHRGKRPLFYHVASHTLSIASAPRALFALNHVPRRLNPEAMAEFLVRIGQGPSTLYEGIYRLPPAHVLVATTHGIEVREYWSMDAVPLLHLSSDTEYLSAFREVLSAAVRCRLRDSSPTGALLSGGLDSSSVTAMAARELEKEGQCLVSFTAIPRSGASLVPVTGWYNDESPYIAGIAAWYGNLKTTFVQTGGVGLWDGLDRFFQIMEAPIGNPANRVWLEAIIAKAAEQGIRALLHGQEGNHWVSYRGGPRRPALLGALVRQILNPVMPAALRRAYRVARRGREPWREYTGIRPEFARKMGIGDKFMAPGNGSSQPSRTRGQSHRIAIANDNLSQLETECYALLGAASGLEFRDPTADKRVIEFCLAIPDRLYRDGDWDRLLIRRGMHGLLPQQVLWNTSRGLQAADWFEQMTSMRPEIGTELGKLERSELAQQCLDLPRLRRLFEAWPHHDRSSRHLTNDYLAVLLRSVTFGKFIRWFEES